jgi:hypothetical protein
MPNCSCRQRKGMVVRLACIDGGEVGRSAMLVQWFDVVIGGGLRCACVVVVLR